MSYIPNRDFLVEVHKGNVPGHSIVHKFGRNPSVAAATEEGVLQVAADFNWLTAATTVRIKSGGNANDTAAGNGAREVTVYGLDDTGAAANEAIATAGASESTATTTSFWRVFRAVVTSAGTYTGNNDGNIVIENGAGGTDLIQISATEGQSQFGAYSVPLATTAYLLYVDAQVGTANNEAAIRVWTRDDLTDASAPVKAKRLRHIFPGISGLFEFQPRSPSGSFPALSDIWLTAEAGGGSTSDVSIDFELLLVAD